MLKNGFSGKLVAAYCHLIVHFMMSVFVDKQKATMCNWFKYTYLSHVLRRPGEALDLIEKTHWSPNSWCVSMHMLSLEDDSPVSGLKASWHIFFVSCFFARPCLDYQTAFNKHQWAVYGFSSLTKFPSTCFLLTSSKLCCRQSKFHCTTIS